MTESLCKKLEKFLDRGLWKKTRHMHKKWGRVNWYNLDNLDLTRMELLDGLAKAEALVTFIHCALPEIMQQIDEVSDDDDER